MCVCVCVCVCVRVRVRVCLFMCVRTCVRLQETDFLHSTFHLYDSEEEEVEETIEPSDHM